MQLANIAVFTLLFTTSGAKNRPLKSVRTIIGLFFPNLVFLATLVKAPE